MIHLCTANFTVDIIIVNPLSLLIVYQEQVYIFYMLMIIGTIKYYMGCWEFWYTEISENFIQWKFISWIQYRFIVWLVVV